MPSFRIRYLTFGHFKLSFKYLIEILKNDLYIWPIWIIISSLTLFILLWLPNLNLLFNILSSDITISAKLDFLATTPEILSTSYSFIETLLIVAISILQGLSLSLLIVMWRKRKSADKESLLANGLATSTAVIGAGCGACGTSLIYPVLSGIGVTSLTAAASIGVLLMTVGVAILIYSIHRLVLMIKPLSG